MVNIREDWLSLTQEDAIDPEMEICDPHHHFWYDVETEYSIDDFLNDISGGHRVVKTVFVESRLKLREDGPPEMRPLGETEHVREVLSQRTNNKNIDIAAGIVGFADLTLGSSVESLLTAHISAAGGRFRGIRQTCAWDSSPEFKSRWEIPEGLLSDGKFREGFSCLEKFGLSFDAWLFHPQLRDLESLAKKYPGIKIIINHIGGPLGIGPYAGKREEVFSHWKHGLRELSKCPNVFIKLGGLGMPICGFGLYERPIPPNSSELAGLMAPYYLWCIECFGIDRCMFESNFPVDKLSYSYTVLWNAFKKIVEDFSFQDRCALFYDTAVDAYHI
jgi:predicted TIM-barrel fold metal-dependent hydrolase